MAKGRILYIDDDLVAAELVRIHLELVDFAFIHVPNGERGIELASQESFDVILVDYSLPGISGLEVIKQLHNNDQIPVFTIMVTAAGNERIAVEAMKAGASDYIIKDVGGVYLQLLEQVIAKVLEKRKLALQEQYARSEQQQLIAELEAFSYAVGHDLKHPLSILLTSTHLLARYLADRNLAQVEERISMVKHTVVKMNDTLDALLLFARVRQTTEVELNIVDMVSEVKEVFKQLEDFIEDNQATFILQGEMPAALSYAPWVERVLINYITNAIKYGGDPPVIEIGADLQSDGVAHYWVRDNGDGIDPEDLEKLFLPFSRLKDLKAEGYGLGLAIVSLIVHKLGGEVTLSSTPGEGSIFGFTLPTPE